MLLRSLKLFLIVAITAVPVLAAGDDTPPWLRQAAAMKVPPYDKRVSSVVLVDESVMTVGEDGRVTTVSSYAVRILSQEGRGSAMAVVGYETDIGKIRDFRAWLIRPAGTIKTYGKDQIFDEGNLDDVYNESRLQRIVARDDAEPGSIFGYQVTTETRPFFNQSVRYFQDTDPVLSSKLTLQLPAGWKATSITFNHAKVEPVVNGTTFTWELRDIPPIDAEPASPSMVNLVARLAVNYFPGEGTSSPGSRTFDSWTEVSRWYSSLSDVQATPNDLIAAKAKELTAGSQTELEKIRAIGRFAQNLQYISIQIGVGRWRPHAASEVLKKSYGDCKDKANLMRAMLKVVGIESFPVLIYSGDPNFVQEIWPSPRQFNHCIVAVKISDETIVASVVKHAELGRLLIFDATDKNTPVGDLPDHEQGSLAVIAANDLGGLVRMPATTPEANQLERLAEVQLLEDGSIEAKMKERSNGQAAVDERRAFRGLSTGDYKQMIERWVTAGAPAAKVLKIEPADEADGSRFALDVDFQARQYGQVMQNRLLIFRPAIVSRRETVFLTEPTRKHPVVLGSYAFSETVRVKLPVGFDVDELPDPVKLDVPFATYKTSYEVKGDELVFSRSLAQKATTIPAEQYQTVRGFFDKVRAAEQSPVVLARK